MVSPSSDREGSITWHLRIGCSLIVTSLSDWKEMDTCVGRSVGNRLPLCWDIVNILQSSLGHWSVGSKTNLKQMHLKFILSWVYATGSNSFNRDICLCACVCLCVWESVCVCVCVCVRERLTVSQIWIVYKALWKLCKHSQECYFIFSFVLQRTCLCVFVRHSDHIKVYTAISTFWEAHV